ncbi:kinase-like protein [Neocallimastix californiae]|uniref:Kinase-like protein n=1 Tax=Neocallimastix californiae TaxID=1754190 RepID=A0A1Y2D0D4_9FUNG|nr:kinase-like protein [Neocallimastix californiae]|eukprot:ORY52743.1 kinase-like protein [Neocallimastix californiae]
MICLQPFSALYEKEDYKMKVTRTNSSTNSTLSVASDITSLTDSTTVTVVDNLQHQIYMNRYKIEDTIKPIETDCSLIKFATDLTTKQIVILKFIKDKQWSAKELEIMEILNNKNIKHVIKLIDHFVDSESNRDVLVLPRLKPIPKTGLNLIDIQKIAIQLFNTLNEIHNLNIVHLDITLSNLMFDENDDLVIIDFGLARICDRRCHPIGCGTPGFVAPEVYLGECKDTKPDIYSAGVVLGMLLVPFIHNCSLEDLGCRLARHSTTSLVQDKLRENYLFERYHYTQIPEVIFDACDLLVHCLEYDHDSRISLLQAIRHPFLLKPASAFRNTEYSEFIQVPLKKIPSRTIIFYR